MGFNCSNIDEFKSLRHERNGTKSGSCLKVEHHREMIGDRDVRHHRSRGKSRAKELMAEEEVVNDRVLLLSVAFSGWRGRN